MDIDQVRLNLNQDSINILKIIIGLIMLGVALDLKVDDFKRLILIPKLLIAGFFVHYLLFPLLTYLLIISTSLRPSIALGLALVAICPAGNLANLITNISKGNTAISIGITSITTLLSTITMPFALLYLSRFVPDAQSIMSDVKINTAEIIEGVFIILGFPLTLGMVLAQKFPDWSLKMKKIMSRVSIIFLLIFIIGALATNYQYFLNYIHMIIGIVFIHNLLAISSSFITSKIFKLNQEDTKGIIFPITIKNTALGLAIVFQFFNGMGGMALIVAWWGVSQIALSTILAKLWKSPQKTKVYA